MNDTATQTTPELEKRIAQYVALRDKIKDIKEAHVEKLKPFEEALDKLNVWLLDKLNQSGAVHIATEAGTIYRIVRVSAAITDGDAFWKYVQDNEAWDLLDRRANVTGTQAFAATHGTLPPGVKLNSYTEAGVRRSAK